VFCFSQALHLTKSQNADKSVEVQRTVQVVELEEANAQLCMELNAAQSKLSEVERHEQAMTSTYEDLKKDIVEVRSSHAAVVKEKMKCVKARRFQNSLLKKLAELHHDTEASVATLGGRCVEFPIDASVSDLF
jgi:chromosome segregation ATPase